MLKFGNTILLRNVNWLANTPGAPLPPEPPDYNPLNLPPFTFRVRFNDGYMPDTYYGVYTLTQVSTEPNIWDLYYPNPDWSMFIHFEHAPHVLEVLGGNTTGVTDMSNMLFNCVNLYRTAVFDTRDCKYASNMFAYCTSLDNIPDFDFSNSESVYDMFGHCNSLKHLPYYFRTPNDGDLRNLFARCISLVEAPFMDLSKLNTNTSMAGMFTSCEALEYVPAYDTSKVTNMHMLFAGCKSLKNIPYFNTSNVTDMSYMFTGCEKLESVPYMDTSKVTTVKGMFYHADIIKTVPAFDLSSVTNMREMFNWCEGLEYIPDFKVKVVDDSYWAFLGCPYVKGGALNLYNKFLAQPIPVRYHVNTFGGCGAYTETGAAELAQIPASWGGTAN